MFAFFGRIAGKVTPHEMNPVRDILAELTGKEWADVGTILKPEHENALRLTYWTTIRQPPPETGIGTSSRERPDMPTRRMFRFYDICAPQLVIDLIIASPIVRVLSDDELRTTKGGACKGVALDGTTIADNLFLI